MDGSPAQPGPFITRHGQGHCTIQVSTYVIVVTGGEDRDLEWHWPDDDALPIGPRGKVTKYHVTGDNVETPLAPMNHYRTNHACGVYQGAGGQQVSRVNVLGNKYQILSEYCHHL